MSDQECTAVVRDGEAARNPLFTPPCDCPRCAPTITYDQAGRRADDGWLRISGERQRHRVELVALGPTGRASLG